MLGNILTPEVSRSQQRLHLHPRQEVLATLLPRLGDGGQSLLICKLTWTNNSDMIRHNVSFLVATHLLASALSRVLVQGYSLQC